jgi:hypothetical protein
MSDRKQADLRAEYRAGYLLQIEALLAPGLTDVDRVRRFADAAGFSSWELEEAINQIKHRSVTCAVWYMGGAHKSLFASLLPDGCCPIIEVRRHGTAIAGMPTDWNYDRPFTRDELEAFSRVQLERRFPE